MKTAEEALNIARIKYKDAIRGKEYQEELTKQENISLEAYEALLQRRKIYIQDIALLENVFGIELLQSEVEKAKPIYRIGQKVWYVDDFYCTPNIRVLQCTIERINCCELRLIDSNNYFLDVETNDRKLFDNPDDAHSLCNAMIKKKSDKIKEEWNKNAK